MRIATGKMIVAVFLGSFAVLTAMPANSAVVAFTSFENEPILGVGTYIDTGNAAVDHDLVNNANQPLVDSTAAGSGAAGDLGFNARYESTGGVGLTDGDDVGVSNNAVRVGGAFADGNQGYIFTDTQGRMILEFDPVSISNPTMFELDYYVITSTYEAQDVLKIFLTIDGSTVVNVLDTTGLDIDDLNIEGRWITGTADLTGLGSSAVLSVIVHTDASTEGMVIDRVTFTATAIPEPASLALATLSAVAMAMLRRRRS